MPAAGATQALRIPAERYVKFGSKVLARKHLKTLRGRKQHGR